MLINEKEQKIINKIHEITGKKIRAVQATMRRKGGTLKEYLVNTLKQG